MEVQPSCELRVRFRDLTFNTHRGSFDFHTSFEGKRAYVQPFVNFIKQIHFMQNNSDNEGLEVKQFKQ